MPKRDEQLTCVVRICFVFWHERDAQNPKKTQRRVTGFFQIAAELLEDELTIAECERDKQNKTHKKKPQGLREAGRGVKSMSRGYLPFS